MKNRKGFTLVELLAVIVILAIIMIIAIPSVLGTLETARQKTFVEYVTRVMEAGQNQYLTQVSAGSLNTNSPACGSSWTKQCSNNGVYFFDIKTGLGLSSTGSYEGWVAVKPSTGTSTETTIYVALYDTNYATAEYGSTENSVVRNYIDYTKNGEPKPELKKDGNGIQTRTKDVVDNIAAEKVKTVLHIA